ncbi:hypothetical protein JL193_11185 [Polaribacter batillariae]|uniref:Uncharacterized protein n=1 Tax=Polaribacter batillariae TaxID=2808900 RepID=A0ABX7SS55_9FLAO|nr:hypothetical protein [Polaribacter batillariae]QTD36702.1 hypothetical protein JL193_11185 [Polaribacter batillariae]
MKKILVIAVLFFSFNLSAGDVRISAKSTGGNVSEMVEKVENSWWEDFLDFLNEHIWIEEN